MPSARAAALIEPWESVATSTSSAAREVRSGRTGCTIAKDYRYTAKFAYRPPGTRGSLEA